MIAGRYELDREVGRGGMGAVWLGRDTVLGREVALKRIAHAGEPGSPDLERASREARLTAALNHPHVVAVFDLIAEEDAHWLVMEYVEGETLSDLIRREGPLSPGRAADILGQAADGLVAAHAAGIVHRDVKPSNIMLSSAGTVKLTDFGIARAEADAALTQTGLVTGSPGYLAPEVASGSSPSPASDVWSMGATMFHALSGSAPYQVGDNLMGALYRIVHEEPPRLADPGWVAPMLEHTMVRDPGSRWTMQEVRRFLLQSEPTVAAPTITAPAAVAQETAVLTQVGAPVATSPQATSPQPVADTRTRPLLPLLLAAAGLLIVAVIGFIWMTGDPDSPDTASDPGSDPSTAVPTTAGTASGAPTPSTSPTVDVALKAQAMQDWARNYLAVAVSDQAAGFAMLTPAYQAADGGFKSYEDFWSKWSKAEAATMTADPVANTVSYHVVYTRDKNSGKGSKDKGKDKGGDGFEDDVVLHLVETGDGFLIDSAE